MLAYLSLLLFLRISGKRTPPKLNAFDLVVTISLGSTLATILLDKHVALAQGALAVAILIGLQFLITWSSIRARGIRWLVTGEPELLLYHGTFLADTLRRERVTEDEVRAAVRAAGWNAIASVEAVVLETDGSLSVVKSGEPTPPLASARFACQTPLAAKPWSDDWSTTFGTRTVPEPRFLSVTTSILSLIVAALLLFFGQRLYWLFVGGVGFVVGMDLAARGLAGQPEWMILLAAILAGIVGAVLAIFFQRIAIGLAGFMAGGYLAQAAMANFTGTLSSQGATIAFVLGGILVAILVVVFLDWALIATSALLGAAMISQWAVQDAPWRAVAFAVLFVAGAAVQAAMLRGRPVRAVETRAES